jgi:hypothetical protein
MLKLENRTFVRVAPVNISAGTRSAKGLTRYDFYDC